MTMLWVLASLAFVFSAAALGLGLLLARRYRELHTAYQSLTVAGSTGPEIGTRLPAFSAVDVEGEPVDSAVIGHGDVMVAFLSASCGPCATELPAVCDLFAANTIGADRPLAVVLGAGSDVQPFVAALRPVARVVTADRTDTGLPAAFGVETFPTMIAYRSGAVRQVTHTVAELAQVP